MLLKSLLRFLFLVIFIVNLAHQASAKDFPKSVYTKFLEEDRQISASLNGSCKTQFEDTRTAFSKYLEAEEENLAIFDGELVFMGQKLHIYRDNLASIIQTRRRELFSIRYSDKRWLLQQIKANLMHSFIATNRRVPYDRGEKLRPSFRKVDRAWQDFLKKEEAFYRSFMPEVSWAPKRASLVLHDSRLKNLYEEYKGVIAIKIEKEE